MNEQVAASSDYLKGLRWWSYYRFPLVPQWKYRPADQYNSASWCLRWLALQVWTNIGPALRCDISVDDRDFRAGIYLVFVHIAVIVPIFPERFSQWAHRRVWRTPRRGLA